MKIKINKNNKNIVVVRVKIQMKKNKSIEKCGQYFYDIVITFLLVVITFIYESVDTITIPFKMDKF